MATQQTTLAIPRRVHMTAGVFEQIKETIGSMKAEQGGILGGRRKNGKVEVTHFHFDSEANERSGAAYTPNNSVLNHVLKTEWKPQGIEYVGSIHSHPQFITRPSMGDEGYAKRILEALDLPYLLTPIVTTIPDTGKFSLFPYAAIPDGNDVKIVEQKLYVGGKPVEFEKPSFELPWEMFALGGIGLMAAGFATAELFRALRRNAHEE